MFTTTRTTFSFSHMSRDKLMEQQEQKPNLFGLSRVATEEDEVKEEGEAKEEEDEVKTKDEIQLF